ncbi:MAG: DUF47 domain-containing protein [Sulfobacillus thermosulfidooxidans]|uniref:Phosphate transport regulator n=1 Tax=Sulfobacillus thermotolerans TaxID=338644 RepID=A0ABN5GZ47_9FIRM|nr:DUF47 family protein [Sulfobacillus sp. hq2]AUW93802.1 hypothetical protein BXT84_07485 [Sulfobacillus thermotolerans]POB11521.1 phosphate transport regulator [Sulfobacillus sp. hq2]PSR34573.1 MAG: DUF47 domain-containing protein [Sulfobacillus thermosulfidooxidans]
MSWKDIFQMSRQVQNFDRLLADQSQYAVTMVGLLKAYVENGSDETKQRQIAEQASDLEHAGDRARITIVEQLYHTFVTPFDREDINDLSQALDDIVDYAENSIKELALYQTTITSELLQMIDVMGEGTAALAEAVQLLPTSLRNAGDHAVRAKTCENKMEGLYRRAIADLGSVDDIHALIKMREIYRHLSNAADRMDQAANVLIRVAIKQGH